MNVMPYDETSGWKISDEDYFKGNFFVVATRRLQEQVLTKRTKLFTALKKLSYIIT